MAESGDKPKTTTSPMRDKLLAAGVRNLKEYGYPSVTAENILTDRIYSGFFKSMLEDNKGKGADSAIDALLAELGGSQDNAEAK